MPFFLINNSSLVYCRGSSASHLTFKEACIQILILIIIIIILVIIITLFQISRRSKLTNLKEFSNDVFMNFGGLFTKGSVLIDRSDPKYKSYTTITEKIPLKDHSDFKNFIHNPYFINMIKSVENDYIPAKDEYGWTFIITWKYNEFRALFDNIFEPDGIFTNPIVHAFIYQQFSSPLLLCLEYRNIRKVFQFNEDISTVSFDDFERCLSLVKLYSLFIFRSE